MAQKTTPVGILLTGLALGMIGYILFYGKFPGAGLPIFTGLLLMALVDWAIFCGAALSPRRLWLIAPVMFFAAVWALRANATLRFFDLLAVTSLLGLFAHYLMDEAYVDDASTADQVRSVTLAGGGALVRAAPIVDESWRWAKDQQADLRGSDEIRSVLRGVGLAVPVLLVFGILLSSADLVFAQQIEGLFDFMLPDNVASVFSRLVVTGGIAWLCTGLLNYALNLQTADTAEPDDSENGNESPEPATLKLKALRWRLNMTEAGIVLGGVVVMFAVFVIIQFAYLFGGREMVTDDLTFSDYARRGFFELVAVSVLVLGMILVLDRVTIRHSERRMMIFRLMCSLLVIETLVILVSAWRRMSLYEAAWGFTHLRIYTHVFMIWLGALLGVAVLSLFRLRKNSFSLGLLLVTMGYLGTLNLINVDALIATRNIERYYNGHELDLCYFERLSVDALDVLVDFYEAETGDAIQTHLNGWFDREERRLSGWYDSYFAPAEYHVSQYGAWQTLTTMKRNDMGGISWKCLVWKDEERRG